MKTSLLSVSLLVGTEPCKFLALHHLRVSKDALYSFTNWWHSASFLWKCENEQMMTSSWCTFLLMRDLFCGWQLQIILLKWAADVALRIQFLCGCFSGTAFLRDFSRIFLLPLYIYLHYPMSSLSWRIYHFVIWHICCNRIPVDDKHNFKYVKRVGFLSTIFLSDRNSASSFGDTLNQLYSEKILLLT